jgi:hypothetical protein
MCSRRGIFDWGDHPLIRELSRLRHTGIGNLWAPLLSPDRAEGTRSVLANHAAEGEFPDTRDRLAKWPLVRQAVEKNLTCLEREYDPFVRGLDTLSPCIEPKALNHLVVRHGARMREVYGLDDFVRLSRHALTAFYDGIIAVSVGSMSVADLGRLHGELLDAYCGRRLFPDRRGV